MSHHLKIPQIGEKCFIASNATIIGEVQIKDRSSVWFGAVVRGDVHKIEIGEETNIQDLTMCHVSYQKAGLKIGDQVTIGHSCILHGCTIGNRVLVGMGTTIMDHADIGDDCVIGAGSLVTENTKIPSGSLAFGRPAKVIRPLTLDEISGVQKSAKHYQRVALSYVGGEFE